jgi:hypothetical protein
MKSTLEFDNEILHAKAAPSEAAVVIADLVALKDDGATALVVWPGQTGSAAVPARTTVDLYARHIGCRVALVFASGRLDQPIVIGVVRRADVWSFEKDAQLADVEADGERLVVTAKEQLTLRCGGASITLTKDGKVLIEGTHISSKASSLNRIVGGSVQIN